MKKKQEISRRYIFTRKELKEKLDMDGEPIRVGLWRGRSPNDVKAGKDPMEDEIYIDTKEGTIEE